MISSLQTHWGFTRMPFGRDLPADNLFRGHAHNEAVARLRYLISARGLHGAIATALGQAPRFHHATLIPQVERALHNEYAERGRHILLIIDEAHLLDGGQLEAVRMLTNGQMDSFSPLSILLVGQPDLRRRIKTGDMAALVISSLS